MMWRGISAGPYEKELRELAAAEKSDVDAVRKDLAALDKKATQSRTALEIESLRKVGTGRYCWPRHTMTFDSINEG